MRLVRSSAMVLAHLCCWVWLETRQDAVSPPAEVRLQRTCRTGNFSSEHSASMRLLVWPCGLDFGLLL